MERTTEENPRQKKSSTILAETILITVGLDWGSPIKSMSEVIRAGIPFGESLFKPVSGILAGLFSSFILL